MTKLFTIIILMALPFISPAQVPAAMYVAHKAGLSIREKPDVKAKVLDKIPYGTKIQLIKAETDTTQVFTDGLQGYFRKVTYNGKTGYLIDSYLFSVPPPKATVKKLKDYLDQLSAKFGTELVIKSGSMQQITESGYEQRKQLYKNGGEYQQYTGYEYGSETAVLPNFTIQQAYLLLRLIPEFSKVVTEKDEFPTAGKKIKKAETEYDIKIEKEEGGGYPWINKIKIEYSDGAFYFLHIYKHENDAVIFSGSGV